MSDNVMVRVVISYHRDKAGQVKVAKWSKQGCDENN